MKPVKDTSSVNKHYQAIFDELKIARAERPNDFLGLAFQYLDEAIQAGDKKLQGEIHFRICVFYNNNLNNFEKSNEHGQEGISLARELNDVTLEANCMRMLGVNYNYQGELIKSREVYGYGIRLLEDKQTLTDEDKEILAGLYFNTVSLYKDFGIDETRLSYIDKSFKLFSEIGNKQGIARTYISYANYYPGIKGSPKAIEYYTNAAEIFEDIKDMRGLGNAQINIGYQHCLQDNFETGMDYLYKGTYNLEQGPNKLFVANGYFYIATSLRLQKKYDEAIEYCKKVEAITDEINSNMNRMMLYEEWAMILEAKGDAGNALQMYKRAQNYKEQIIAFEKSSAISEVKLMFELEERKREADFLRKKNTEIEEYVRKLEISNFELRQFAHVASHDLKEPLRMVTLYMQLLEKKFEGKMDEDGTQYLNYAKEGANRMYGLIQSLLTLTKINAETDKKQVDLNVVLNEALEFLKPQLLEKGVEINKGKLPKVNANHTHMLQVFQNLISNAAKYNRSKTPVIDITCMNTDSAYYFTIADNGIGIAEKYREKVFDIFQRLHSRNEYTGTGIGLTICKKIIEQLNGRIWIESNQTGGSKVCFTIPK
jgi:signal transduction histidine kinase